MWTNSPCVLQDFFSFGAAAQNTQGETDNIVTTVEPRSNRLAFNIFPPTIDTNYFFILPNIKIAKIARNCVTIKNKRTQ